MSDIPDDYMSENPIELSETQKFGKGMRIYGFIRLGSIIATFVVSMIASSIAMENVDINTQDFTELEQMLSAALEQISATIWYNACNYIIDVIIIVGLIIFLVQMSEFKKFHEEEQNIMRIYYLFVGCLVAVGIGQILSMSSLFISSSNPNLSNTLVIIGIVLILSSHGIAIAGYYLLKNWGVIYERQMGSQFPLLSSRFRRMYIGEILIVAGNLAVAVTGFLGVLVIFGEIFVGFNLIRAGRLLMLDTFPQSPVGMGYMGRSFHPSQSPQTQKHYPDEYSYQPPQKLIPDKAYFCPSCGAQLVSESQDFCMKCGNHIPKPNASGSNQEESKNPSKKKSKNWKCKFCGAENEEGATICENCGEKGHPE
jgi:hypothetical protein